MTKTAQDSLKVRRRLTALASVSHNMIKFAFFARKSLKPVAIYGEICYTIMLGWYALTQTESTERESIKC